MDKEKKMDVDIWDIIKKALSLWWIWVITGVTGAVGGFTVTHFTTPQTYTASSMLYVNNSPTNAADAVKSVLTQADISAAQSAVDLYCIMAKTRTCLDQVDEKVRDEVILGRDNLVVPWENEDGSIVYRNFEDSIAIWHPTWKASGATSSEDFKYNYDYIVKKMEVASVEDTEIFSVSITSASPFESILLAKCVSRVIQEFITSIVNGTSVKIVDEAQTTTANSRHRLRNGVIGGLIGGIIGLGIVVLLYFVQDDIQKQEWLSEVYEEYPILATIPDAKDSGNGKSYYYYSSYGKYGYGKKEAKEEK